MLENKKAKYRSICWIPNGKKRFDIWSQKEVDDKDNKEITGTIYYEYDDNKNYSTYKNQLINLIQNINNNNIGFTYLEIFQDGRLLNVFRISKVDKACFKTWEQAIEYIKNNE